MKQITALMLLITTTTLIAGWGNNERYKETREDIIDADRNLIEVDGGTNGGVSVMGWDRNEIKVTAEITTWARTEREAEAMAAAISIDYGQTIHAKGPSMGRKQGWSVSFALHVPYESNLDLRAHNGGISIGDVTGEIDFKTLNGGVSLDNLAGDVRGRTTNGGVRVTLTGKTWQGNGLDVETTNGGIRMSVPADYSADLETGTVNGGINIDFPVTVSGKITKRLVTSLGKGGALIRVKTTNGGVKINQI